MTVIKRIHQSYNYPNSANASDTESLHLGSAPVSDTESLNNEPATSYRPFRNPAVKLNNFGELINIKKHSGKKRLRRYQNHCVLQTLNEEDEDDCFVTIMEPYKSPFTRLLENEDAMEFWNQFIEKSEEEQNGIMERLDSKYRNEIEQTKTDKPFRRISAKIRRTIKIRKNLSAETIKVSELEIVDFFKETPEGLYVRKPPTSFDRLLLHAIAQYHNLQSKSVLADDCVRLVEVYNCDKSWVPAECYLFDFIAEQKKCLSD